jgi:hypothetical protein
MPKEIDLLEIDDPDDWEDITDQIERSLWEIMNKWNVPEDEIKRSIFGRRNSRRSDDFLHRVKK